ncbi:MAG: hypothetical protein ACOC07_13325, partial [Coleofasciculus sp.]
TNQSQLYLRDRTSFDNHYSLDTTWFFLSPLLLTFSQLDSMSFRLNLSSNDKFKLFFLPEQFKFSNQSLVSTKRHNCSFFTSFWEKATKFQGVRRL